MKYTFEDLHRCAQREVGKRRKVYPRLVRNGVMSKADADRETEMMQEIADLLGEKNQPKLL